MPFIDPRPDAAALSSFLRLCGDRAWTARLADLALRAQAGPLQGRAAQQRHAVELVLARMAEPAALARASLAERRILAFAQETAKLANKLPPAPRRKLKDRLVEGLSGEATLIPLFHLVRSAALYRSRGFEVRLDGLVEGAPYDLLIERGGIAAEVACETVSAEEGRPVHRGDWYALVDRINPDLQTWLAAHPGRYLLKMTLPEGLAGGEKTAVLHQRIMALLAAEKRQDAGADAVLKLDPLLLAGAQATLPARLRAQFGPEAHLAVTTAPGAGSVFVMAARAGKENAVAQAVSRRMAAAAEARLTGSRPAILAMFVDDVNKAEWRSLRETLELEGAARRFLTDPLAKPVVAVACASRMELFGFAPPDAAEGGELRFRSPTHAAGRSAALAPAVLSSV